MPRQYKPKSTLDNFDEVNKELLKIAKLQTELAELEAQRDKEKLAVENKYSPKIKLREHQIKSKEIEVEKFCNEHKRSFNSAKSIKLGFGVVGFRDGNFSLKKKTKLTWDVVRDKIEELTGLKFIKVDKSLKKQELINAFNEKRINEQILAEAGCSVEQKKDEFYYQLNFREIKKADKK
jgi:phage host-nuclease inhibitor protein Gam